MKLQLIRQILVFTVLLERRPTILDTTKAFSINDPPVYPLVLCLFLCQQWTLRGGLSTHALVDPLLPGEQLPWKINPGPLLFLGCKIPDMLPYIRRLSPRIFRNSSAQ